MGRMFNWLRCEAKLAGLRAAIFMLLAGFSWGAQAGIPKVIGYWTNGPYVGTSVLFATPAAACQAILAGITKADKTGDWSFGITQATASADEEGHSIEGGGCIIHGTYLPLGGNGAWGPYGVFPYLMCPANSTATGSGDCGCNTGYVQEGNACVVVFPPEGCAAGANGFYACPGSSPPAPPGPGGGGANNGSGGSDPGEAGEPGEPGGGGNPGGAPGGGAGGGLGGGSCKAPPLPDEAGNPIFAGNGNKYQQEVDLAGPHGLAFVRHYNSQLKGWVHNYMMRVQATASAAGVVRPTGKVLGYVGSGAGAWTSNDTVVEKLTKLTPVTGGDPLWQLVTADDTVELYDANGLPVSVTYRGGRSLVFAYSSGALQSVTDNLGRVLQFAYDSQSRLGTVTAPGGETVAYSYGSNGHLATATYADATSRQYLYEDSRFPYALTGLIDQRGLRFATWAYDSQGRAISTEYASGIFKFTLDYDPLTSTSLVTDPLGTQRVLQHQDVSGKLVFKGASLPCPNCRGDAASNVVNSKGLVTQSANFTGVTSTFAYDESRLLMTTVTHATGRPEAQTRATTWHTTLRVPTLITEAGRTKAYTYDTAGNKLSETVTDTATAQTRTWAWTYTAQGLVQTMTEPNNAVWTYAYDSLGNRATVTNPLLQATTFTHDAAGRVLTQTDPNGLVTSYGYDLRGRLTSQVRGSETTAFSYIPTGQVGTVTQPNGYRITYGYDAAQRLTTATDNLGAQITYTLDAMGNRTREEVRGPSGAIARATQRTINALNRVVAIQGEMGQTVTLGYNANGEPTSQADALTHTTTWTLDGLGRQTTTTFADNTAASQGWNQLDQLTRVTDPRGLNTSYQPNAFGETQALSSPDTGTATMTYDAAGNLATRLDSRGVLATYSWDALNRLRSITYSQSGQASLTHTWNYDQSGAPYANGIGRLTSAGTPDTGTHYAYDSNGRLATATQVIDANPGANTSTVVHSVRYGHDAGGNLTSITYPSGRVLSISHSNGRPTAIALAKDGSSAPTDLLTQIQFTPLGALATWQWNYASGPQGTTRTFDASGRLIRQQLGEYTREIGYDSADRIKSFTHVVTATSAAALDRNQSFDYDALGRLTSYSLGSSSWTVGYDANGNRTGTTLNGGTRTYSTEASSNRLMTVSSPLTTYTYDATGNVIGLGAAVANYDLSGRWASTSMSGTTLTATFNALGQRVRKYTSAGSSSAVLFVYDQQGQLLGEYDNAGNAIREYVWLGSTPVAMFTPDGANPPKMFFIQTDHIDTPRVVVDRNQATRWIWMAEPFGTGAPEDNPSSLGVFMQPLRFPGQYFDVETGTHYNYFRDYDPWAGRYLQSDPIGLRGGQNTYAYVGGNPSNRIDPTGEFAIFIPVIPIIITGTDLAIGAGLGLLGYGLDRMFNGSSSNPLTGEPGGEQTCDNKKGNKKQTRRYGPDGYPDTDTDWDHSHDGLGKPHVHDWTRPSDGSPPTDKNRQPGRPPKSGDPGIP